MFSAEVTGNVNGRTEITLQSAAFNVIRGIKESP